jgi:hypothetical protein
VLSRHQLRVVHLMDRPLTEELMKQIWFSCTVISTTALDCAMYGIPVFLCGWLDNWPFGYLDQFAAYGVGMKLSHPEEIAQIPLLLETFEPNEVQSSRQPSRLESWQEMISAQPPAPIQVA